MTAVSAQGAGNAQNARSAPVAIPIPSPGTILAQRVAGAAETAAVRNEQRCESLEQAHALGVDIAVAKTSIRERDAFAGEPSPAVLALTREDKSTSDLYLTAIARVRDAYFVQESQLTDAANEAQRAWSVAGLARAAKVAAKLQSVRRRIVAFENCAEGKVCVHKFGCSRCGQVHTSPPLTCNQRCCPACVPKLRAQNIAHVLDLLEGVDRLRQQRGERVPRWRFLTLTVRSFADFAPMRRFMAKAWGKLIRHRFWRAVKACVACWETTHTTAGWHVHVHALVDTFLPRELVVRAWRKVTEGLGEDAGVHISEPKGGRKAIARELAKYVAKDLGGAGGEQTAAWGVAGDPHRLAEFLNGSFRWRTLRTYGDCYSIADMLKNAGGSLWCDDCGVAFEYLETVWMPLEDVNAHRASRSRVANGGATAAAP